MKNAVCKWLLIGALAFFSNGFAQKLEFVHSYGAFDGAVAFSYVSTGYFYVVSEVDASLKKLDSVGTELANIGGYGWEPSAFDSPSDVFATPLRVYVADKNNNRIQVFDRFLNYQFEIRNDEVTVFPQSCAVSEQGDIFILDSDNLRILKYDMFGNFVDDIGGIEAGKYTFEEPKSIAISGKGDLFVLDKKKILIFDLFGNGKRIYDLPFEGENINIYGNIVTVNGLYEVVAINLLNGKTNLYNKISEKLNADFIVDALVIKKRLYVLSSSEILVFKIKKSKNKKARK